MGASPREFVEPRADTLILSTTNGTRTVLAAAERCDEVLLGSLLNLERGGRGGARAWSRRGDLLRRLQGRVRARRRLLRRTDRVAARAPSAPTRRSRPSSWRSSFPDAHEALLARTYGPPGLEEDILFCSRESVLPVVPRFAGMAGAPRRSCHDRRLDGGHPGAEVPALPAPEREMSYRFAFGRPPAVAAGAMVATSQPLATRAGLRALERGRERRGRGAGGSGRALRDRADVDRDRRRLLRAGLAGRASSEGLDSAGPAPRRRDPGAGRADAGRGR